MNGEPGCFEHHRENGGMIVVKPLTTRPRIDRLTTPTRRAKYQGDGDDIQLGSEVVVKTLLGRFHAQVWAQSRGTGYWWVVDAQREPWSIHESDLELVRQCVDVPLFDEEAS